MNTVTQAYLKEILNYNPDTGVFTWLVNRSRLAKIGSIAGSLRKDGYIAIIINRKQHFSHRLAWLYVYGSWPENQIDHINLERADNRLGNLREATKSDNCRNQLKKGNNTSGYKGVNKNGRWRAQIKVNKKNKHLGYFDTKEEASEAYKEAAHKYHGEFACY